MRLKPEAVKEEKKKKQNRQENARADTYHQN
jgi:hypothetical protein